MADPRSEPGILDGPPTAADYRTRYLKYRSVLQDRATSLPVFPVWLDRLRVALDGRRRLGVLQVEIVNLDLVESLYGWQVVDRVLGRVAEAFRACVGKALPGSSLLAVDRVCGDRLIAFLPDGADGQDCDVAFLSARAAALKRALRAALADEAVAGLSPDLGVRVGQSLLSHDPFQRFERRVYGALDEARRFLVRREKKRERSWSEELERIIRDGEVDTVFQPLVDLKTRAVHGYEALTRGPRDSLFEAPRAMFAMSSRVGSEARLDRTCLETALRNWSGVERTEPLFVNLRPEALAGDAGSPDDLARLVESSGRRPRSLVFEFSERASERDLETLVAAMEACSHRGFGVALDDAGTGLHTREIVERARPTYLKLDESLVRGVHGNWIKRELLSTLVGLGRAHGARVVAEGVETEGEAEALAASGASYAQGYFFGSPAAASAL